MANLSIFAGEYQGNPIRVTEDGRFSVFDVLLAFGVADKLSNAKNVLDRLRKQHPELLDICSNFKFPGRGQRDTPVASEEGLYEILMLCPGKRGAEFRAWAAKLVRERREEESNGELAYTRGRERAKRAWRKQGMDDETIAARLKGIESRNYYTDALQAHGVMDGVDFARCTNAIYQELFDTTAKGFPQQRGLAKSRPTRDAMTRLELSAVDFSEALATHRMKQTDAFGADQCSYISRGAAGEVRELMDR